MSKKRVLGVRYVLILKQTLRYHICIFVKNGSTCFLNGTVDNNIEKIRDLYRIYLNFIGFYCYQGIIV